MVKLLDNVLVMPLCRSAQRSVIAHKILNYTALHSLCDFSCNCIKIGALALSAYEIPLCGVALIALALTLLGSTIC